jgi:hypothetical protein
MLHYKAGTRGASAGKEVSEVETHNYRREFLSLDGLIRYPALLGHPDLPYKGVHSNGIHTYHQPFLTPRLYLRFTLSFRDVEELLAERGLDVSYETVRSWVLKFGPIIARRLRRCRSRPSNRWHLDEMALVNQSFDGRPRIVPGWC